MRKKELEMMELRERIFKQKSFDLWNSAVNIWEKRINYSKKSIIGQMKYLFIDNRYDEIKEIQMELLDKEIKEYLKEGEKE